MICALCVQWNATFCRSHFNFFLICIPWKNLMHRSHKDIIIILFGTYKFIFKILNVIISMILLWLVIIFLCSTVSVANLVEFLPDLEVFSLPGEIFWKYKKFRRISWWFLKRKIGKAEITIKILRKSQYKG